MNEEQALFAAFSEAFAKRYKQPCERVRQDIWRVSIREHRLSNGRSGFTRATLVRALEIMAEQFAEVAKQNGGGDDRKGGPVQDDGC